MLDPVNLGSQAILNSAGGPWSQIRIEQLSLQPFEPTSIYPKDEHILALAHSTFTIQSEVSAQKENITFERLDVAIAPLGSSFKMGSSESVEVILLYVNPDLVLELALEAGYPSQFEIQIAGPIKDPLLAACLLELRNEVNTGYPGGSLYGATLAKTIGIHLLNRYCTVTRGVKSKSRIDAKTLTVIIEYLKNNLQEEILLSELAALAHMSPHHFLRMFKASTGLTPHQYLINYRICVGKRLLASRDLTIKQISKMVGFCDAGHFSRHFKRITGTTPGTYASRVARGKILDMDEPGLIEETEQLVASQQDLIELNAEELTITSAVDDL